MERLGDILKTTRLEKNLTLEQVEIDTNIRRDYLAAMENEDWERLPEYIYFKNFLRTYCRYLGLADRNYPYLLIEALKPKPHPTKVPQEIDLTIAPSRKSKIFFICLALIVLLTTSYVYQQYFNPFVNIITENPLQNHAGEIEDGFKPTENITSPDEDKPDEDKPIEKEITHLDLTLKCIDDRCWVEIKDGENNCLYRATMTKNEEISFANLQKINLVLGNAGQMLVFINEQNMGKLGKINEVVTAIYQLENNAIIRL